METPVIVATIAASVAIVGWVANHILSGYREKRNNQLISSLKYTERQLEELYGPLYFLILEGKRSIIDLLETLGRNYVFLKDEILPENELKLWLFWIENDFFPRNDNICKLLMTKTHLIDGSEIPKSYLSFLDHYNSWKIKHLRWKKEGVKYSWRSKIDWPPEFEEDIISTFKTLKAKHTNFLKGIRESEREK